MINVKVLKDSLGLNGSRVTTFELEYPRFILSELNTHRCLVGDTKLYFDNATTRYHRTIEDVYNEWTNGAVKTRKKKIFSIEASCIEPEKEYDTRELANILGLSSTSSITNWCRRNSLVAKKVKVLNGVNKEYKIKGEDLIKFINEPYVYCVNMKSRMSKLKLRCINTKENKLDHTFITDIWKVGEKEVFELKTKSGNAITATLDHPFYTGNGYTDLKDLKVGDSVCILTVINSMKYTDTHGKCNGKWLNSWTPKTKPIIAKKQNNKCFDCHCDLGRTFDLHHLIPRYKDPTKCFDVNNVIALCKDCHNKRHHLERSKGNTTLCVVQDEIVSIESKGIQTVYDLSVASDEHNFIANKFVVHNCFSRNSASSRAIPLNRMIELVMNNPVIPHWTKNQKGMSGLPIDPITKGQATDIWKKALSDAVDSVSKLQELGIHKQNANRLLEPFQHMKTVLTGTDFDNFFNLRIAPEAQPEICELARKMKEAMNNSVPQQLGSDDVHCPYIDGVVKITDTAKILESVALCAQVSYRRENRSEETVRRIINNLLGNERIHASPFEHICWVDPTMSAKGNLKGFTQLRHCVEESSNNTYDSIIAKGLL